MFWRALGSGVFFEFIITVSQVGGATKDKPDIFLAAAKRFGCNPRELCLYDDALEALRSAKGAGLRTVCVYDDAGIATAKAAKALCDMYIDSFLDIL